MKKFLFVLGLVLLAGAAAFAGGLDTGESFGVMMATAPLGAVVGNFDLSKLTCVTAEEFEALKAKYRHIYVADIQLSADEKYQFILRRPSREMLSAVKAQENLDKATDVIFKNMVVAGDMDALDDGLVYAALDKEIGKLMSVAQSFLGRA